MSVAGKISLRSSHVLSSLLYDCMNCQGTGLCGSYIVYLVFKSQGVFFRDLLLRLFFSIVDGCSVCFVH